MTDPALGPPPTYYNIQLLRGVAAMIVVGMHLQPLLLSLGLQPPGGGVELFFVISGFIMTMTTRRRMPPVREFLAQRLARIVPIYWLFTFGVFIAAAVLPALFQNTRPVLSHLLLSLTFIPFAKTGMAARPLLFVGWTLNYEMAFYVLFALGLAAGRRGAILVAGILILLVAIPLIHEPRTVIGTFYTSPYLLLFALGIGVALVAERSFGWAQRWPWLLPVAITLSIVPLLYGEYLWAIHPAYIVGTAATVLVLAAIGLERGGIATRSRTLLRLGDASYAIYLSHPFLTVAVVKTMAKLPQTPLVLVLTILATFVLAGGVGWLIHLYIERPLTTAARRLLLPREAPRVPWTGRAVSPDTVSVPDQAVESPARSAPRDSVR